MFKPYFALLSLAVVLFFQSCQNAAPTEPQFPNIIYILADDLGYGDVSALNDSAAFTTPNIDALAHSGMTFTDAHSGSAVCTPTRYGILTGRYAWRSSLQNGVSWSWDPPLIPSDRQTVADLLKAKNYHTACIGKWHLGLGWGKDSTGQIDMTLPIAGGPNELGFDYFYGITASLDIPPYVYIQDDRITATAIDTIEAMTGKAFWRKGPVGNDFKHEEVLPVLTEKAVSYIRDRSQTGQPFFLYFPLPAPHTPILPTAEYQGKSGTNAYGDFVLMVDDVVGQIRASLDELGITDNTLLIFTSDNGCSPMADFEELAAFGHDPSGIFRGNKADIFEGGHRIPFLAQWPAMIPQNSRYEGTVCLTDLMASCAAIVGDSLTMGEGEDSVNLLPVLSGGKNEPVREATVHHSINGSFAIRQGKWKLNFCPGSGGWSAPRPEEARKMNLPSVQLYDIVADPSEQHNLAAEEPEVTARLTTLMEQYIRDGTSRPGAQGKNDVEVAMYK
ncbi:MAG: sulfatase-like hydrolase/transferase [Saprospiraceae bacterium]|nr:sulfatase-like hydrolase/transferase [Lewinella sp.]